MAELEKVTNDFTRAQTEASRKYKAIKKYLGAENRDLAGSQSLAAKG